VREFVKWDYELRNFSQVETVVDRALEIAMAEPRGPVYLTLPREVLVLAEEHTEFSYTSPSRGPARFAMRAEGGTPRKATGNPEHRV
jgi:acetolactate synthase-1/2/3 large subunit